MYLRPTIQRGLFIQRAVIQPAGLKRRFGCDTPAVRSFAAPRQLLSGGRPLLSLFPPRALRDVPSLKGLLRFASAKSHEPTTVPVDVPTAKLTLGAVREKDGRSVMTPANVKLLLSSGFGSVKVESGLGEGAEFSDAEYKDAGAIVVPKAADVYSTSDVVFRLFPPTAEEVKQMKSGVLLYSFIREHLNATTVTALKAKKATVMALDRVPRTISKAQAYDAMTSQLGLAGYKAVLAASDHLKRPLSGKMTMAGKYAPAKVLIVGAAVAGLEAISTAKNLGAEVFATDSRPEAADQIVAAGGKAVAPDVAAEASVGGYAKVASAEYQAASAAMYKKLIPQMDIVITTAQIPGRPAPRILSEEHVALLKKGAVVVDLAAGSGGNVAGSVPDKVVSTAGGATIIGAQDLASALPSTASTLLSNNVTKLLLASVAKEKDTDPKLVVNLGDEVTRCTALMSKGDYLELQLGPPPAAAPAAADKAKNAAPPVDPAARARSFATSISVGSAALLGLSMCGPPALVGAITTFALSVALGYYVVWGVTHALHSPLMSITNAVSGLVFVGGMMMMGGGFLPSTTSQMLGALATGVASVNIFGGFLVTQRMLNLFRRPTDPPDHNGYLAIPAVAVAAALVAGHMAGYAAFYQVGYVLSTMMCVGSLAALSSQETCRMGVSLGVTGVSWGILSAALAIASATPVAVFAQMGAVTAIGGAAGLIVAQRISTMDLPQLVAAFHSLVGLAASLVCIACHMAEVAHLATDPMAVIRIGSIFWGAMIGGVTLTGSLVAFLKLDGKLRSGALSYPGRDAVNIGMLTASLGLFASYCATPALPPLLAATALSCVAGWHLVDAVGGADMPVCVTVLNSYSGWALVAEGLLLNSSVLVAVGCVIGSSGAILTYIMCVAMNRSLKNVLFGSYASLGSGEAAAVTGEHRETNVADTVDMLVNARKVTIVPGFGLCQGQGQYAVAEMCAALNKLGVKVEFGIHPVAGRMPGQLNVLLAEAGVPYDIVHEMEEVNPDMPNSDISLVIGANDVVNPAEDDPNSALAGMPVIQVWNAKTCIVMKRSMATGYAGVQNPLFFKENTQMLFGDARKVCEALRDGVKDHQG